MDATGIPIDKMGQDFKGGEEEDDRAFSSDPDSIIKSSFSDQKSDTQEGGLALDDEEHLISPYGFLLPYNVSGEDDDDDDDDDHFLAPEFIEVGWGSEDLQDAEDIDFEFVYALHTFVATVEGQANAAKGDTMVLLDDSNSYWWLVRVVKDSSIGTCGIVAG